MTCWGSLRHLDALLALWGVLRHSELLIYVLSGSKRFKNLHSETLSWVLNSLERLLYVLRHSIKFLGVILLGFASF